VKNYDKQVNKQDNGTGATHHPIAKNQFQNKCQRNNDMLFERALYVYIIAYGCHMCSSAITMHSALHFVTGWLAGAANKIE
jgi:hypothetical protein